MKISSKFIAFILVGFAAYLLPVELAFSADETEGFSNCIQVTGSGDTSNEMSIDCILQTPFPPQVNATGVSISMGWPSVQRALYYDIQQSMTNGNWQFVQQAFSTNFSMTGSVGRSYRFRIRACDGSTCSDYSNSSNSVTLVPPTPARPSASQNGFNIYVTWAATTGASSYRIRQRVNGSWQSAINTNTSRSRNFNVAAGSSYQYQVRACNSSGCSAWSSATASIALPAIPTSPAGLSVNLSGTTISASWNAVSGATSYSIRQRVNGNWQSAISTGSNRSRSFSVVLGSSYQYQVRACNSSGCSGWSASSSSITVPIPTPVVQRFEWDHSSLIIGQQHSFYWDVRHVQNCYSASPGANPSAKPPSGSVGPYTRNTPGTNITRWYCTDLSGNRFPANSNQFIETVWTALMPSPSAPTASVSGTSISVQWGAVSSTTNYKLQQRTNNGSWQSSVSTGTGRTRNITGSAGSSYQFRVQACHANGVCSSWSAASTAVSISQPAPGIPASLAASLSNTTMSTSWNAVSGATSYNIRQRLNGSWQSVINTGTNRSRNFTVSPGSSYQYQVRACNTIGCSGWSGATTTITVPAVPTIPAIPAGLAANLTGSTISTSWNAVSGATSYNIRQRLNGSWQSVINTGTNRSRNFTVTAGSSYQYQVRACNSEGCSGWSGATTTITVPAAPTIPAIPPGLLASLTGTTISTSWNAVSGATSYNIRQRLNGSWQSAINTGTNRSRNFTVTAGSSYQYQVRACNGAGCSNWSLAVSVSVSGGVVYIHTDILGSVIAESDETGTIKKVLEYKPYGKREEQ